MSPKTYRALQRAIQIASELFPNQLIADAGLPHWVFRRQDNGGWQGQLEYSQDPRMKFYRNYKADRDSVEELRLAMAVEYSKYFDMMWIGNVGGRLDVNTIIPNLLIYSYSQFKTFKLNVEQQVILLEEVDRFLESQSVCVQFIAPIFGLTGPSDIQNTTLPMGITFRSLSEGECSAFYGDILNPGGPRFGGFPTYALSKEAHVKKVFGEKQDLEQLKVFPKIREAFEMAVLALASFREFKPIGYDEIRISSKSFSLCPVPTGAISKGGPVAPFGGSSVLTREDLVLLEAHSRHFNQVNDRLIVACHRLVDANRRSKPEEAIIDAVIGLESILLYGIQQELAFRFALNYSILDFVEKREEAYEFAKYLYGLRSRIVHGTNVDPGGKFGPRKVSLGEMAAQACGVLRKTICLFVMSRDQAVFTKEDYWEKRHLQLNHK